MPAKGQRTPILERIIAKTDFPVTGCWEFTGNILRSGYGQITRGGHSGQPVLVHRAAWECFYGPIPQGVLVCHRCDNPKCWRPSHLFLGTHKDNSADMVAKDRHVRGDAHWTRLHPERVPKNNLPHHRGEDHGRAKLTRLDVEIIRRNYALGGLSYDDLAQAFGVTKANIRCIVKGWTWKG